MNRQQQQQVSQTHQSQVQQTQQTQQTQQRVVRTEQHVTRQVTGHTTVQGGQLQQGYQQIAGFGPNAQPPVFEKVFSNARFAQGGVASFEGRVTGKPQPEVTWQRKGAPLLSSNKHRLTYNETTGDITFQINQIGPGDEGEYVCTAKNQYGAAICSVFIQPEGFPAPQRQAFQRHEQTTTYSNGTYVQEDFKIDTFEYRLLREVSFRESITKRIVGESDYQLSTTVERSLGPPAPPQISQKPRNSKLLEGSDAVFSAKLSANPRPRITWFRNGQRITESQKYESSFSNNQATLRVKQAASEDSGHYTLLAENPQGCVVSSAYLAIEPVTTQEGLIHESTFKSQQTEVEQTDTGKTLAPNFVRVCGDRDVTEGKMTRFDCRITGRPYPEVTWYINGRQVTDDHNHKILVNESGNHALMITTVSRVDSGVVTCVARNKTGETSFQCNLNVIEKEQVVAPKFVERFTTVNVREGEPVLLNARAVGTPIPRITWQKDGVPLSNNYEIRIAIDGGATSLDIPRAKASDAGWYQCTAQNVAGSTATRARLFVETPQGPAQEPRRLHLPRPTKVIEPEPEPGPEVIYLRHVERAKPHPAAPEEDRVYPPPQFIIPLQDAVQLEGGKVHFEARIEPVGDPTMRVEWFVNGRPLEASSRANIVFRFGFIALDLISLVLRDSGEYLCRVTSATGSVESRALLSVNPRASIEQTSQHPDSLKYIQQLEDYSKYQRSDSLEETVNQKPHFIRPLQDLGELQEGRNAHFEAQLTPVSDPTMKVEWYKDGRPITASSRITTIFNFGYVSLNIMHLRAEDAGSYTVRAVNRLGEAISSGTLQVYARSTVTGDLGIPEQQRYIEKVEELEAYQHQQHQKYVLETPESSQPPEFKTPIKDQIGIREGGFAHFEARLEPVGDSTLKVEWLKDGRTVEASSRITSFFNFGYVALTIKDVTIHDVGNYTCRAYNALGQAVTTAQLSVVSKKDIIFDSQHPGGLEKIQYLEDASRFSRTSKEEVSVTQKPRFLGPLKGTNKIVEGQRAHFEARVEPQSDLTLKIEWYFNGKPIQSANRIQTYHDFGYVALDITSVREEDSGTYTVVARNALGEAQLSASMVVETRASIDTRSMHRSAFDKTQRLEESKFVEPHYDVVEVSKSKPIFVVPLSDPQPVSEGRNVHLECRLEPMGDPTMRVEWFCNGRPITVGSRFRTYNDFGFVALDIIHTTAIDSGEYTVRAVNQLGSAHTSACVRVIEKSDIITETQHEQSLEQIQMLEDSSRYRKHVNEDVTVLQAPQFTRPLHNIETIEGTNVHMECRLQPVGDPSMRVDWFVNGIPVKTGHRFRPAYDFDYVALDLLSVYPADSGVYTCQARNQLGEAVTSCSVKVIAKKDLLLETQHPSGLEKIQYLEDASRYKRTEFVDEQITVQPKFVTRPKPLENMVEGQHAHFECKLEPVTDPNLKVEWFKNGRQITVGHRFRPIHDFGYVALDIVDLIAEDSGTYTCRATNLVGVDETTCSLRCRASGQIVTSTQNEVGLQQIQHLEDRSKYHRSEDVEERTTQAPIFTTSLKNVDIKEGQRAHFECRLIPVSDATMKVEWFHNGLPLKSGSRFTETNNFGFVALDILYAYPEDSGTYTCRATNILGEAVTSAVCNVHSKKSIYSETVHEGALQRLTQLEDASRYQRQVVQEETVTQAPVFTLPIKDLRVAENQAAHFEARLIPVGDSRLKVEWLRNGVPIEASNRLTTMHDFGYVALNMKYVNPEDSGTYTCRAVNELGEAVTSATLFVQSKASLQLESQHEGALQKLRQLEDSSKYQRREEEEIIVTQAPRFSTQLNGPTELVEGQSAHYECRIEPYPDSSMKVEWLHNGQPLSTGHRFRTAYDFGFASLDILTVYAEDSGEYTCRVTNRLGQAQSSVVTNVKSKSSIIRETQHEEALQKIQYLEDDSRYKKVTREDAIILEKPQFGRGLRTIENLPEGSSAHLEATLTPVNDPTMRVEWFCNGRPIQTGHRFKTTYDFGFVALDILYAYAEDSGTYMCRARNAAGEAVTTANVGVVAKSGLYLDTLDEQRLKKIRDLESYERPKKEEVELAPQRPVFLTPLVSLENLKEGEHAHLECRVEPVNDANLRIDWYVNGVKLRAGHRFRTTHDFGYVALDVLYTYPEDSGTYMCKATNLVGEAVNTCTIKVGGRKSILLDTHHPEGLEKIRELEAQGRPTRLEVEEPVPTPPRLVTELRGTTEVYEGKTAHFEAQVEPIHDSSLRIEFYHNGKPLPSAARFHITFDFGYIALDIGHCVPEDAGEYSVKAINNLGQCTSSINLKVIAKDNIILESQRPEGLDKIRQLEEHVPYKRPEVDEPVTRQRPVFTQPLQNIDSIPEGQTAHFECRLIPVGDPTLKVEWFRNEKPLEDSSRITKVHDFGFVSLDISHVRDEDEGVYICRASNPLGEAVTTASMKIRTKASIQLETQHPEAQRKIAQLEQPLAPRPEEPERHFEKPIFTQILTGPTELWEGQHAHFEARVVPVGDPNLRFEWYVNGVELKLGSRFKVTHDFGFVTLDIMSTVPEDSGVYMCKAINKSGEAVSSISMRVKSKSNIVADALQPDAWQKIQLKEAEMNKVPDMFVDTTPQQPPVFTTHLKSYDKLIEGQHVYLEAQVEPRADPNLRIEWFKNGISLTTGARLRSTFDFGLVTLSINSLRDDDSAIYTCKATNLLGEAISTCSLKIEDRHWLLGQTLHPDAIPKLEALEKPQEPRAEQPEPTYELPIFISHLNNVECTEGDNVHFECNVEPSKDPTLKIEWFINGKPLPTGTKYKSTYDFGYVALDINHVYEHDAGIYTCKATNNKGSATTSGSLRVTTKTNIYLDTQHPQGKAGLEAILDTEEAFAAKYRRADSVSDHEFAKPVWTVPLNPEFKLVEGQPLHLEGTVEPKNDPNLKIEWFFNGKSLDHGTRFKLTSDFGFVTLDLTDVYERDQGIYTCKASNKSGEAFTSTTIYCTSKANLIERTQHPKGQEGLEKIQDLEDSLNRPEAQIPDKDEGHAPVFTSEFTHLTNLSEGEIAHFEAGLTPIGDQTMVVEWFYNGKTIEASHRFRTVHAFGMVVLEVLGCKIEDSGTYTCKATNKWGVAEQSVTLECTEKIKGQKPKFTTQIQNIVGLKDGQSAHFECTLIPVNDPDLKVEWYHNGQQILQSSRIKTVSDFGFVVMDISYIQDHDSGEYVCRAYNKYGEDFTKATISAHGKGGVFSDSLQPDSLAKIRELESLQGQQAQVPSTPVTEPPKFITQIQDVTKLVEGQSAHFEARLTPVTDPDLVVEWYYNGKKLPHGHRYRTFHDFGIVILDILYCYEENSGTYECRAYNKYGEDSTKATLKCVSKTNLILDSQLPRGMEGGLEKIQTLEDSLVRQRDEKVTEEKGRAPVFTVPLSNIDSLREGESAHFEARLIPTDDPKLKVEWFWNGKALRTGSRFRTFCDFGFVILEISPVYPEDSGEYSCRAFNDYGEAVTTASMKVQGKRSIILESQLPKGMEGTIDKIAELEGLGIIPSQATPDDDTGRPPEFITTPSDLTLGENSLAHFECKLIPVNDQSMRVEWFHNGKALWAGSRIKTINDFGFVILEVAGVYQRDSGLYTCKATNRHGEATVSCKLQVRGRQGIILEPQLPSNFKSGTESIQKLEETLYKREEITTEEEKPNPPRFIVEIKDNVDVPEGGPVHFDCRVEPTNDPTMRIDWFHNGRPFATGSRVHQINDFGFISLDIDYTYSRDAGEYICRATNKWGSATTKATVTSKSKRTIDYDSQLPSGISAEKLKELERGKVQEKPQEDKTYSPPKFITHIESSTVEESESVHFECRVEPKDDPKLRIEWYRNGKLLPSGHRYRTVYDMGFVSLDILYVYAEDSGEYVCRAVNDYGEDFTKANITCKKLPNIILQNQVPKGMKKSETLMQMEAAIKKYTSEIHLTEDDLYDADKKQPPRFVTQIQNQESLVEMETSKFECQLAPVGDPNMKVEWFFNGKPLPHKNRFTPIYDFGYVAMNFGWVYPEDSGEYLCRATNLYGMDETRAIIKTAGKPGIIYDSQLPKGMKSIEKIRELEAAWQIVPEEAQEESKPRSAPIFVSKPEPCTVQEGDWARYCCRVTGHPRPRVMWLINGHTVVNGSRYKLTYDGMYHMDIPKTRQYDTGKVEVIARSSVGEAIAETELKVIPRHDDYRGVLKNSPRPWYDLELSQYQKERSETELERVFDERNTLQREQGINVSGIHVQSKEHKEEETEWQKSIKTKKTDDYYSKLQELENEQVIKEIKLRESSHQFAIPGEKIVSSSLAKGMAQKYQDNLEPKPEKVDLRPIPHLPKGEAQQVTPHRDQVQLRKTDKGQEVQEQREVIIDSKRGAYPPDPTESGVHGREVYVTKQRQTQKENVGDTEITRHITATETTDVEHKAKTQERVVQGQVLPSNPPVFTKKIQPCLAFENTPARFEVEFDGDPLPKVTWFREDFPITSSPDLTIYTFSTKSILVLRQVFLEDSGVFSVVAENRGGTAKCSANLVVQERRSQARGGAVPPSFVTTIQSATVNVGQLVRFDARINGSKPIDVYWLKNGKKIISDIRYKTLEEDEIHTLLIIEVVPEDSGKYECVAINSAGEARCEAECLVQRPATPSKPAKPTTPTSEKAPSIVEPLKDQKVREGQAVAFRCKITGKPAPTIQWQKGDKIIKPSKYFQMVKDGDNYTLKISEAFPEDEGVYKCVAKNPAGTVTLQANLKVLAPETQEVAPSLTPMKDVIVPEGSPAQFKTTVAGKPKPTVQWLREGFLIPDSPDFQMIHEGNNAVLLISTTYEEDSGTFTCRATSSAGQVERSAKLIVKSRPGTYRKTPTTDLTSKDSKPGKQPQVGPGPAGPGQTTQKFVPGSKGGGAQPTDKDELPAGDETLPWRQKPQSAQPWTQEQITLKKTQIKTQKEIVKEQIEDVQLKPTKIQRKEIPSAELETVDLKHRTKTVTGEKTEEVTSLLKQVHTEDTTLLDIDERTKIEKTDHLRTKDWRRGRPQSGKETTLLSVEEQERLEEQEKTEVRGWRRSRKDDSSIERRRDIEETTMLSVDERQKVTETKKTDTRDWRKPTSVERRQELEDTTLLSVEEREKVTKKQETETKGWRRPRKDETSLDRKEHVEDSTLLDVERKEEVEETRGWRRSKKDETVPTEVAPEEQLQKQEPIPWNKQEIKLKPTPKDKKDIPKEKIEEVQLKPSKPETKVIPKEQLETVDLKPVSLHHVKETVTDELDATQTVETAEISEVQPIENVEEKPLVAKSKEEPIPWNKQPITLKKTPKEQKEIPKEKIEEVQLKPTRRESKVMPEELEVVDLKPVSLQKIKPDDSEKILTSQVEDSTTLKVDESVKETEKTETRLWRRGKKATEEKGTVEEIERSKEKVEEPIPWNKQEIVLKRRPVEPKEIPKEKLEEVQLKPTRRESKQIPKEELEVVSLTPVSLQKIKPTELEQQDLAHVEDTTILKVDEQVQETIDSKEKHWRRTRKEDKLDETKQVIETEETEEIQKPLEAKEEPVPWNKQEIVLKKAPRPQKEVPKEKIEEVQLKPTRRESKQIPKEELEVVNLTPVSLQKIKPTELKQQDLAHVEDTTILKVDEQVQETIDSKEKHWRRTKKEDKLEETKQVIETEETEEIQKPLEAKEEPVPWNKQEIVLKKAPRKQKEVPKEKIEEVQLKPARRDSKPIPTEELEVVDLKPISLQKIKPTSEEVERASIEDSTTLIVDQEVEKKETPKEKHWRKTKKEQEEHIEVTKEEIQEMPKEQPEEQQVPWNKQEIVLKKTPRQQKEIPKEKLEEVELKPRRRESTTIEEQKVEEVVLKPISLQKIKPKEVESTKLEETITEDTTARIKVDERTEEIVKTEEVEQIPKTEEIPWNKQEIKLKRTVKERKEIPKEKPEAVELKPTRRGSKVPQEELEVVELKPFTPDTVTLTESEQVQEVEETKTWRRTKKQKAEQKTVTEIVEDRPSEKTHIEDKTIIDFKEETVETKDSRRPIKPDQGPAAEPKVVETKEEIPWNKQEIVLKRTPKERKETVKEEIEQVNLKHVKKDVHIEEQIVVDETVHKEDKSFIDTTTTEEEKVRKTKKIKQEPKGPKPQEPVHTEDKEVISVPTKEDIEETSKSETRSWRRPKKPDEVAETPKEVEVETVISAPTEENVEEVPQPETRGWRRHRKDDKPAQIEKPEEEVVPWNKQTITLKRSKVEKKPIEKPTLEDVTLKPFKTPVEEIVDQPSIEKIDTVEVTEEIQPKAKKVKPKRKPEENVLLESEKPAEEQQVEEAVPKPRVTPSEQVEEVVPKIEEARPWRRPKQVPTEKPTEEKPVEEEKLTEEEKSLEQPRRPSKPLPVEQPEPVQAPWTQGAIKLKRTPKQEKPAEEEQIESVTLKPIPRPVEEPQEAQISDAESEEDLPLKPGEEAKTRKTRRVKKIKKKKQAGEEEDQISPEEIKREEPSEEPKQPESVIVETVTEVEDIVVLKVDDKDKPKKLRAEIKEEVPEIIKLKPVKRAERPQEEEIPETVVLKPVQKFKPETPEVTTIEKKPRRKKYKDVELPEDAEQYVPEEAEKVEFEKKPNEVEEIPAAPWRREPKPKPEVSEEEHVPLKIGKGKVPIEEEVQEQVRLKPIKKDIPKEEKPTEPSKPFKPEDTQFIPSDFEKQKFEPTPREHKEKPKVEQVEEFIPEEKPSKPEIEETVTAPWRRTPKQKVEEIPEETQLPKGKRKPKEEEKPEPIQLKPFKKEQPEVPTEKVILETVKLQEPVVTEIKERDDEIKFKPSDREDQVEEEKEKKKRYKKKPKDKEAVEEIPEEAPKAIVQPQEVTQPQEEIPQPEEEIKPEPEVKQWRRGKQLPKPEEEQKEIVTLKPIPRKEEVVQPEQPQQAETVEKKIKTQKIVRKSKSHVLPKGDEDVETLPEEERPELIPTKVDDVPLKVQEAITTQESVAQITLAERKVEKVEEQKREEKVEEEEDIQFQKAMNVAVVSKKKTTQKRVVRFDDYGQPIPELEIISQKRITEVIDKVPDEPLQEDIDIHEEKTVHKSIVQTTIKERAKKKTVAPKFTKRVEPVVSEPDQPTQLVCKVEGTPFPEIAWYKNEVLMHATERVYWNIVENTVVLEFAKVEPQDVAVYSCKATNPAGVATSTANLVILEKEESGVAPHFVEPLKPQIVEEKTPALLQCKVIGTPTPTVRWYKDRTEVVPSPTRQITYNPQTGIATLELLEPNVEDQKFFTVKADNKFGQAECKANLIISKAVTVSQPMVMEAPRIIEPVKAVVAKPEEEEVVLEAVIEGVPAPEIKWLKNNKEITTGDEYDVIVEDKKTILKIKKKVKKKGGKYEVQAVNPKGEVRTSGTVTITQTVSEEAQPPKFIQPINPQYATIGEVVIIEAEVESFPAASFQWFQNLTPIISTPEMKIVSEENRSTLILTDVSPKEAGVITCRAENAVGSVTCTASLNVVDETEWVETRELEYPRFVKPLTPVSVMDGEKVTFSCVVTGKPIPKVQWYHNDQPVREAKDVLISQTSEGVCLLAIAEVFPENAGIYTCKAVNKVGEAVCKSSLIVEAYEYVPDSEIGHMTGSEEDVLGDRTISEGFLSDSDTECAPKIIKKLPQVVSTKDGDVTKLEVRAVGKPKPEGKWLKQGNEIVPSSDFFIENFEDGTSILTISEVYPDDTGDIVYEAQNPLGVAVTSTQLLVESAEGILGTKEYRKPEWVTHMEELQAALKGKSSVQASACSFDMSTDSLETAVPKRMTEGKQLLETHETSTKPFYLNDPFESQASSSASIYSEPNNATKAKLSFVECAMSDYLNSHRHSLSSVMELLDKSERSSRLTDPSEEMLYEPLIVDQPEEYEVAQEEYVERGQSPQPFYILSPIEEKSEPSTRSSSFRGSNGSEKRKMAGDNRYKLSSSCDPIPSERVSYERQEKYLTFPRIKTDESFFKDYYEEETMYPLEPREIDPFAFQQLHTADSQEELQEFLLLESECMNDRGRGLASAFIESKENVSNYTSKDQ